MSSSIEISQSDFLPIKDAAKMVSYTRDYVARLAREEKIVATQINRQWYVDIFSLKNFAEASALEQEVRKQQLSLERKREQIIKQKVQSYKSTTEGKTKLSRLQAEMTSVLVLGSGLVVGVLIYTATNFLPVPVSNLAQVPVSVSVTPNSQIQLPATDDLTPASPIAAVEVPPVSVKEVHPIFIDSAETRVMSQGEAEGIFLLARNSDVQKMADVKALFSDQVEVRFLNDTTGIVSYQSEAGKVKEFPFVSVAVSSNPLDTDEDLIE